MLQLTLSPAEQKPLGPDESGAIPAGSSNDELQAIQGVNTLLEVTKNLKQYSEQLSSPEYSQKILLRGELIQALENLPLAQFSIENRSYILEILNQVQEIAPEVDQALNRHKKTIDDSLKALKSGKKAQKGYYTATESHTHELEG